MTCTIHCVEDEIDLSEYPPYRVKKVYKLDVTLDHVRYDLGYTYTKFMADNLITVIQNNPSHALLEQLQDQSEYSGATQDMLR